MKKILLSLICFLINGCAEKTYLDERQILKQKIEAFQFFNTYHHQLHVMIGEEAVVCLKCDLSLEEKALVDLKNAIVDCEKLNDFVSRDLFRWILDSEEEHVDVIETHLNLVDKVGKENWLQSQI